MYALVTHVCSLAECVECVFHGFCFLTADLTHDTHDTRHARHTYDTPTLRHAILLRYRKKCKSSKKKFAVSDLGIVWLIMYHNPESPDIDITSSC